LQRSNHSHSDKPQGKAQYHEQPRHPDELFGDACPYILPSVVPVHCGSYRRDPTHVVFYRERTMAWLAQNLGLNFEIPAKDVALFQQQAQ